MPLHTRAADARGSVGSAEEAGNPVGGDRDAREVDANASSASSTHSCDSRSCESDTVVSSERSPDRVSDEDDVIVIDGGEEGACVYEIEGVGRGRRAIAVGDVGESTETSETSVQSTVYSLQGYWCSL